MGRSFIANAVASAIVAIALIAWRSPLAELAGIGVSVGSLAAFAASRNGIAVFDLTEMGWEPAPHAARTIAAEVVATAVLTAAMWLWWRARPATAPTHTRAENLGS